MNKINLSLSVETDSRDIAVELIKQDPAGVGMPTLAKYAKDCLIDHRLFYCGGYCGDRAMGDCEIHFITGRLAYEVPFTFKVLFKNQQLKIVFSVIGNNETKVEHVFLYDLKNVAYIIEKCALIDLFGIRFIVDKYTEFQKFVGQPDKAEEYAYYLVSELNAKFQEAFSDSVPATEDKTLDRTAMG
jgi:hypothetical protein